MRPEVQGEITVSDGDHEIDVAEHGVSLIRHMIHYDSEASETATEWPGQENMDDVHNILDDDQKGIDL